MHGCISKQTISRQQNRAARVAEQSQEIGIALWVIPGNLAKRNVISKNTDQHFLHFNIA